jgi:tetratricopeptide (TPR) repeat protein
MLRRSFRFSPFLLVLVLCSCATQSLQLNTESGQPTIVRIPAMYDREHINPAYVKFLEHVFPEGVPNTAVSADRQHFLYRYCVVLFEQRDFAKTIECLDSVQKSTDLNGDPELTIETLTNPALFRYGFNSTGGEFPLTVREPWLRALVMLELGNFRQSAQYADRSLQRFNDAEKTYWNADRSLQRFNDAVKTYSDAEKKYRAGKPDKSPAPTLTGMSIAGHFAMAQVNKEFAPRLTTFDASPNSEIESLSNLAVIYWLSGDSEGSNKVIAELHVRLAAGRCSVDSRHA